MLNRTAKKARIKPALAGEARSRARVGATAYFTAAVWDELGVPGAGQFATKKGRFLNRVVKWGGFTLGLSGLYSVTNLFLAPRHLGLNILLEILAPTQVIELAAGFSARGSEWTRHHPGQYIEVDQAHVIAAKQQMLEKWLAASRQPPAKAVEADALPFGPGQRPTAAHPSALHTLLAADLLQDEGEELAARLAELLDPALPTVIIAEGLTGYLDEASMRRLLRSLKTLKDRFEKATLLIDFYVKLDRHKHGRVAWAMAPAIFFSRLARAPMQMFLSDDRAIRAFVESAGFKVKQLYAGQQLATLAGKTPPRLNLFFVAEI